MKTILTLILSLFFSIPALHAQTEVTAKEAKAFVEQVYENLRQDEARNYGRFYSAEFRTLDAMTCSENFLQVQGVCRTWYPWTNGEVFVADVQEIKVKKTVKVDDNTVCVMMQVKDPAVQKDRETFYIVVTRQGGKLVVDDFLNDLLKRQNGTYNLKYTSTKSLMQGCVNEYNKKK